MKLKSNVPTLGCCKIMILLNTDTSYPKYIKVGFAVEKGLVISYLLPIYDKISLNYSLRDYCLDCLKLMNPFSKWDKVYVILKR